MHFEQPLKIQVGMKINHKKKKKNPTQNKHKKN